MSYVHAYVWVLCGTYVNLNTKQLLGEMVAICTQLRSSEMWKSSFGLNFWIKGEGWSKNLAKENAEIQFLTILYVAKCSVIEKIYML